MSNKKVIDNKVKRMVRLISNWCIDNHAPDFCCTFEFTGYVDILRFRIASGGDKHPVDTYEKDWSSLDDEWSFKNLCETYNEMVEFKRSHDHHFSAERQEEIKEKKRIDEIERLKARLASLED